MLQEAQVTRSDRLAIVEPSPAEWDEFAATHPRGHLLQSSGWAELKQVAGWQARRLVVARPDGYRAGAQVLVRRKFGLSAAYVPRGPLLAPDEAANRALLAALDRLARRERAVFLRLEPNALEDDPLAGGLQAALLAAGFRAAPTIQPRSSVHLELAPEPERLLAAMSKGHRADIKRAAREGVAVRVGERPEDLDAFYAIMEQTGSRAGFGIHSRDYYRIAWERFALGGHARLLLAERAGATVAAFLIFAWAGAGLYLYGGSTEVGLKSGANHALQWQAIRWARERGCDLYDFWGVPDQFGQAAAVADEGERARLEEAAKADPLYGVFRFKKGFGGRVVRYMAAYDRVYLPPLYAIWQRRFGG